jgi:hypothetical protein
MSAPRHTFHISALALILAGLAAATPALSRGLGGGGGIGGGPSMGSINIGPRMNSGISNPDRSGANQNTTPASAKKAKKGKKGKKQEDFMIMKMQDLMVTN